LQYAAWTWRVFGTQPSGGGAPYLVAYFAKLAKRLVRRLEDLGLKVTVSQAA
jgi:hypothetical protein